MGALTRNSGYNVLVHVAWRYLTLLAWMHETWTQWWPTFNKAKMSQLPWHDVEEEI